MINLNKTIDQIPIPSLFSEKLKAYRKKGQVLFNESGLPGEKVEHWMKFDIAPLKARTYSEGEKSNKLCESDVVKELSRISQKVNIVNGFTDKQQIDDINRQVNFSIITVTPETEDDDIARLIGSAGDKNGKYFYNLNSALFADPLLLSVNPDKGEDPLYLSHNMCNDGDSIISNTRIIVEVKENATLDLIESFSGKTVNNYLNNRVIEIILHKNSLVNHLILNEDSENAFLFNNVFVKQMDGSVYNSHTLNAGAAISRNEYDISLNEENCECTIASLFLGKGGQLHNSDVTIHHKAPHCTSKTITKALAGGRSRGVFRGFAIVDPDAQKTDAQQQFKTMLLNDTTQVNMEPHLEIWADDVKCSHGATVGQLDKNQLFYLQTRGYSPDEAKKMLMEAFAADIAGSIGIAKADEIIKKRVYSLMDDLYD